MRYFLSSMLFTFIFSSTHALAIGDREQNILAIMGGLYVLEKIVNTDSDKRKRDHAQVQDPPYRIHHKKIIHKHEYLPDNYKQRKIRNGSSSCGDAASCAYQKGFSDGIKLRNKTSQYCSFYGGC
ncbi:MAG: hypothetical protein ACJA1S_000960 [Cellvibrionaceae bacterium]|jgi:hypothetical protein